MSDWERDGRFKRVAELLWPDDLELATDSPRKGKAAAGRRMAARHEGFRSMRKLIGLRDDITALVAEVTR